MGRHGVRSARQTQSHRHAVGLAPPTMGLPRLVGSRFFFKKMVVALLCLLVAVVVTTDRRFEAVIGRVALLRSDFFRISELFEV